MIVLGREEKTDKNDCNRVLGLMSILRVYLKHFAKYKT